MIAPFTIIGVPVNCGGEPGGVELAPRALRDAGLVKAIGAARDLGDMNVNLRGPRRDPETGIIAYPALLDMTRDVRRTTAAMLARGERPFLVGGCCSYMMGAIAGAADHFGSVGLAYVDGHMDLYDGKTSPSGEAADMPLALMLGHGVPKALADRVGGLSRIDVSNVALLGFRDRAWASAEKSLMPEDIKGEFYFRDAASVMKDAGTIGREARERLESRTKGFWLHLDFDVLDEKVFPPVDYLMPDGLGFDHLTELIRPLVASPQMIGMSLACYNPELDPGRDYAQKAVSFLAKININI